MRSLLLSLAAALALLPAAAGQKSAVPAPAQAGEEEVAVLKTTMGTMVLRFYDKDAPLTTANFKKLVREGWYDGRPFYRVVKGHVIQAGDGDGGGQTVKAEVNSRLHVPGAVGLAREADPDSGSTEFYICLAPRPHLDGKYTIFGQVIEGMDVLEKIGNVDVTMNYVGNVAFHEPKTPVLIEKASIEKRVLAP